MKPPAIEELQGCCERMCRAWQQILRLQDWNIQVEVVRYHGFENDEASGETESSIRLKEAKIRLLDPRDNRPKWSDTFCDLEAVLVHELLHLHMEGFSHREDAAKERAEEQAVDLIAWALVSVARGKA